MQAPLQARHDTDAVQPKTARAATQERRLVDNRPTAVEQRELAEMMNNSPRVLQQRALNDAIHNSAWLVAQRHGINALFGGAVRRQRDDAIPAQLSPAQREEKTNNTGLPNQLKSGIESLSGISMDHVKVHYNSDKPAQLQAHAYAQGSEIHLGAGQERHLPHEAWHVVQQAQGRVRPTLQMKAGAVNDDPSLEEEADMMGEKAAQFESDHDAWNLAAEKHVAGTVTPRFAGFMQATLNASAQLRDLRQLRAQIQPQQVIQRAIGDGDMLLRGRRVRRTGSDTIYRIIGDHIFLGRLEYKLGDDNGNEFFVRADHPAYELVDGSGSSDAGKTTDHEQEDDFDDLDDSIQGDESVSIDEEAQKKWTLADVEHALKHSSRDDPLSEDNTAGIAHWLEQNMREVGRSQSKSMATLLSTALGHQREFEQMKGSLRPLLRSKRKSGTSAKALTTFTSGDVSDTGSELEDPDERFERYPMSMAAIANRSHVYGMDDKGFEHLVTGLPYADTYLGLFRDGALIPRTINGEANRGAHRKRMREAEDVLKPTLDERDTLHTKLTALNSDLPTLKGVELRKQVDARNAAFFELQKLQREKIRPHIESTLFGSSIRPSKEDEGATHANAHARMAVRDALRTEAVPSAAAELIKTPTPAGIFSGVDSHSHAEQAMLASRTWNNLLNQMTDNIAHFQSSPEELSRTGPSSLLLVLNRSSCVGCARELTSELIRFWTQVAKAAKLDGWRMAKYVFEDYISFKLEFPAIYEGADEERTHHENLQRIVLGLRDSGWQVRVFTGIATSTKSDESNAQNQALVGAMATIPMYLALGFNPAVRPFPVPPGVDTSKGMVLINGVRYHLTPNALSLARDNAQVSDELDASQVGGLQFLPTSIMRTPVPKGDEKREDRPKSKLGAAYGKSSMNLSTIYDPILQDMLLGGYQITNVSGRGMNCLIRAIFLAAGVHCDERMVKIVRNNLVQLGVTDDGDMLDLLGIEGETLIDFLRQQGVLPPGTGVTAHFAGGSMVVVPGANQIHLWYGGNHFQAITPRR